MLKWHVMRWQGREGDMMTGSFNHDQPYCIFSFFSLSKFKRTTDLLSLWSAFIAQAQIQQYVKNWSLSIHMESISSVLCNHRGSISFVLLCIHIGSYSSVLLCCYICTPGRPYPGTIFPLLFAPCHNYNYVPNRLLTHWVAWYWTRPFCRHRSWDESRNILCNILLEAQSAFQNRRNDLRGIYVLDSSYQGNRFGLQSIDHLHSKQEWRSAIVRDWENDTQVSIMI